MTLRLLPPLLIGAALALPSCVSGGLLGLDDDDAVADDDDATDDDDAVEVDPALDGWCQVDEPEFSFFVTSMAALWALSGDDVSDLDGGFGGNFGGLTGADAICQKIGTATGHADRTWKAFLSAHDDGDGNVANAIDRIGSGPWTDSNGRLVSEDIAGLLGDDRPDGDARSVDDLPDECGIPLSALGDAHDVVTASDDDGNLASPDNPQASSNSWTADSGGVGSTGGGQGGPGGIRGVVMCGHSFPRNTGGPGGNSGQEWLSDHAMRGCDKGANLIQNGPGEGTCIGCSGGYGALYCFAE